jgi:hypothetical protein
VYVDDVEACEGYALEHDQLELVRVFGVGYQLRQITGGVGTITPHATTQDPFQPRVCEDGTDHGYVTAVLALERAVIESHHV